MSNNVPDLVYVVASGPAAEKVNYHEFYPNREEAELERDEINGGFKEDTDLSIGPYQVYPALLWISANPTDEPLSYPLRFPADQYQVQFWMDERGLTFWDIKDKVTGQTVMQVEVPLSAKASLISSQDYDEQTK